MTPLPWVAQYISVFGWLNLVQLLFLGFLPTCEQMDTGPGGTIDCNARSKT